MEFYALYICKNKKERIHFHRWGGEEVIGWNSGKVEISQKMRDFYSWFLYFSMFYLTTFFFLCFHFVHFLNLLNKPEFFPFFFFFSLTQIYSALFLTANFMTFTFCVCLKWGKTYCVFPCISRKFWEYFTKQKLEGGSTYIWICLPQKKITS